MYTLKLLPSQFRIFYVLLHAESNIVKLRHMKGGQREDKLFFNWKIERRGIDQYT